LRTRTCHHRLFVRTASELRANIYKLLDQALESGRPIEVERRGRILRITPDVPVSKLGRLLRREKFIRGDAADLVHMDWSSEWKP
jgi:hypothetical protein